MRRLARIPGHLRRSLRGWVAQRRLRTETLTDLVGSISALQQRVSELETDLDELRADSRRVAELRIQVEDFLAQQDR